MTTLEIILTVIVGALCVLLIAASVIAVRDDRRTKRLGQVRLLTRTIGEEVIKLEMEWLPEICKKIAEAGKAMENE